MKNLLRLFCGVFLFLMVKNIAAAQQIDFTIKYSSDQDQYEVYGKSNSSFSNFFVGGGSQISVVLPAQIADVPLSITTVNGGIWTDNSQIFAPTVMPDNDFHGIASNGSQMTWTFGEEILLFTFTIPNEDCVPGVRLFDNDNDPTSIEPGMQGSDFKNYFANVFTFEDNYRANYDNSGISCGGPVILPPDTIFIPQDSNLTTCLTFTSAAEGNTHTFSLCSSPNHTSVTGGVNDEEVCLTIQPNIDFLGFDEFCVEVCDQTGQCDSVLVPILVTPIPEASNNPPVVMDDSITVNSNASETICLPIVDPDPNETFSTSLCNAVSGRVTISNGQLGTVCIQYQADANFAGTEEICLVTCDAGGLCDTAILKVVVTNPCPTESPVINVSTSVCQDEELQFSILPFNQSDVSYTWLNADGETMNRAANFTLAANHPLAKSPYQLQVQVGDCPLLTSESVAVTVDVPLIINNLRVASQVCSGGKLYLTAASNTNGQLVTYTWTGPSGILETGQTRGNFFELNIAEFDDESVGVYGLTLDPQNGCSTVRQEINVQLNAGIEAPSLQAVENIVCNGKDVELTATIQDDNEVEFEWFLQADNGDLSFLMTTEHPTLVFEEATPDKSGNYLVRTKKGNCISGFSNTEIITVFDVSTTINIDQPTTVDQPACSGGFVQLNTTFYENATYQWSGPDGFSADVANPSIRNITTQQAGEYEVVVTVAGCDAIRSQPVTVFVEEAQVAPILAPVSTLCEREELTLTVLDPLEGDEDDLITYQWYFSGLSGELENDEATQLSLGPAGDKFSGDYYVVRTVNGCSLASDTVTVTVKPLLPLTAMTVADYELCQAGSIDLLATVPSVGTGQWSTTTDALIVNPNEAVTMATDLQIGSNEFIWTVSDDCGQSVSDTLLVTVRGLTNDVAFAGVDQQVCDETAAQLEAAAPNTATGIWTQTPEQASEGVQIVIPTSAITTVDGLVPGNAYTFTWTLSEGSCQDFDQDEVTIITDELPSETPLIITSDIDLCAGGSESILMEAAMPLFSIGQWRSNSSAIIANSLSPTTTVSNLQVGNNPLIWSLSNASCVDYAADTLNIFLGEGLIANADNYEVSFNDSINFDVLVNDSIYAEEDFTFRITKFPDFGRLTEEADGTITYIPETNFFGEDNFRYKLCSNTCEEVCDTAIVNLVVTDVQGSGICFVPNGLTPNNDNVNDELVIPCLFGNTENELIIFNRWGDEVYSAMPYNNDWGGTHDGEPLPAGTYFYLLKLNANSQEAIQGYLTIFR
ncbi:MAG: gliding motility-associated C-terminal domain-containing protein [Bacteroidota bacterium]